MDKVSEVKPNKFKPGKKKSWQSKLKPEQQPTFEQMEGEKAEKRWGKGLMVIATPYIINGIVKQQPKNKIMKMSELRDVIAHNLKADFACRLTTGIFMRIVAEASEEAKEEGKTELTPWWLVVGDKGELNPKWPGGGKTQAEYLSSEGNEVFEKRGKWFVTLPK